MTEQRKEQFKTIAMLLSLGYILIADVTAPLVKRALGNDGPRQELAALKLSIQDDSSRIVKLETMMENMKTLPMDMASVKTDLASVKESVADIKEAVGQTRPRAR